MVELDDEHGTQDYRFGWMSATQSKIWNFAYATGLFWAEILMLSESP